MAPTLAAADQDRSIVEVEPAIKYTYIAPRHHCKRGHATPLKNQVRKNGKGTIAALNNARIAADAATAETTVAKAANVSNHRELAANAAKKRAACDTVNTAGYDIAAAACGDNFLPAGFNEFAGWSDSAKQILRFITYKGNNLKADEEGERFDAGAEATWATRKHRSFMIHTVSL